MSSQDNPFTALRDAARARQAAEHDDPTWLERAAGRLSPEDEAALEARAESDPLVEHMRVVTAPHPQAVRDAMEARVFEALGSRPAAPVVPLRDKRRRVIAVSGVFVAAAAAVLLLFRVPNSDEHVMPRYEGSLAGADVPVRSADPVLGASRARVSQRALLTLTAQPADIPLQAQALAARIFLVQGASAVHVDVPIELAPSGAVRMSAPYARLFGDRRGQLDLLLFVGLPDALPDADAALARARAPGSDVRVLRFPLELVP